MPERIFSLRVAVSLLMQDPYLLPRILERTQSRPIDMEYSGLFVVDAVVTCFGWRFDSTWLDLPVKKTHAGKYPRINESFEADGVPNLFFIGALSHSLDFRKSSGGFIHGFRHNIKALFRLLQHREGVAWPTRDFNDVPSLVHHIFERINRAPAPFHMFGGGLMDGITLVTAESGVVFRYVYEVPRKIFHEWFRDLDRIEWYLEYNKKFYGHKVLSEGNVGSNRFYAAQNSNFLFPRLHYYPGGQKEPRRSLYLMENARFQFNRTMERESVEKMMRNISRTFQNRNPFRNARAVSQKGISKKAEKSDHDEL
jgi:hypothetical protein